MANKLKIVGGGVSIEAQYNPTQIVLRKSALIKGVKNKTENSEKQQFIRGRNEELSFELLFDATLDAGSDPDFVKKKTDQLLGLTLIEPRTEHPPIVTVIWGTSLSFNAYTRSVDRTFTLFDDGGRPLRATVNVTFIELKTDAQRNAEVGGQKSPHTSRWVVESGDTLTSIAAASYGDPAAWREIVLANEAALPDPMRPVVGTVLMLPPRPF